MDTIPRLSDTEARQRQRATDAIRFLAVAADGKHATTTLAAKAFVDRFPDSVTSAELKFHLDARTFEKAAIGIGTTAPGSLGGLLPPSLNDPLIQAMQRACVLDRIPGLIRAPMNVRLPNLSDRPTLQWVRENGPKPGTRFTVTAAPLSAFKGGGIVVISEELVKLATGAEDILRAVLIDASVRFVDTGFLSAAPGVAGLNPPGILFGITATPPATNPAGNVAAALAALFTQRPSTTRAVVVTSPGAAATFVGTHVLADLAAIGVALITSPGAGANIIALDPGGIFFNDSGGLIDVSQYALIQMNDAPDSPPTAATTLLDLWGNDLRGFRIDRFVTWRVSDPTAVAFVTPTP